MKKEEKELIFNLLKKADASLNGYQSEKFKKDYIFQDDDIQQSENPIETNSSEITPAPQSQAPSAGMTISDLNNKIIRCTRCGLARTRNNVVPGMGVEHPDVLVIGEGPGYDEDMQGLPFVGKAGMLLDKMLNAIDLDRSKNCYIANIVKCRPPENRDPLPDEQAACMSFLEAQIHILKPKMILCLGLVSGHKLLKLELPMNDMHGRIYDYNGIPAMVTYHPSALLRNQDLKRPAWEDLKIFKKELENLK